MSDSKRVTRRYSLAKELRRFPSVFCGVQAQDAPFRPGAGADAQRHLVRPLSFEERFRIIVRRAAEIICKRRSDFFGRSPRRTEPFDSRRAGSGATRSASCVQRKDFRKPKACPARSVATPVSRSRPGAPNFWVGQTRATRFTHHNTSCTSSQTRKGNNRFH